MAIPILNHLDLRDVSELRNAILHKTTSASASNVEGKIIYDTGTNTIQFYNGSAWISLIGLNETVAGDGLTYSSGVINVVGGAGITANGNDIEIDSTVVTLTGSQTLTNKTLTAPTLTGTAIMATLDISGDVDVDGTLGVTGVITADGGLVLNDNDKIKLGTDGDIEIYSDNTTAYIEMPKLENFIIGDSTLFYNANICIVREGSKTGFKSIEEEFWCLWSNASTGATYITNNGTIRFQTTYSGVEIIGDLDISGGLIIGGHTVDDIDITSEASDADDHLMTALAIKNRIEDYSYITASSSDTLTNKTIAASQITEISNITAVEGAQLENINSTTISTTQWGYLGAATGAITNINTNTGVDMTIATLKTKLAGGFGSNAVTIGDSSDTVTIPGDLIVTGDTTYHNETIQIVENNTIAFEGTTADDYEVKLTSADATADRTITLPNLGGHVALFAVAPTVTISTTPAELNYVNGVTGAIQTQINGKQPLDAELTELATMASGTAGALADLSAAEVAILDGATLSTTELNYVDGVTSAIQLQFGNKQPLAADLTTLSSMQSGAATATALLTSTEVAILDGATVTTAELNVLGGYTGSVTELNYLDTLHATSVTSTEFGYLDGVTSAIQTQLDATQTATEVGTLIDARSVVATIDSSAMAATSDMKAEIRHNLGTEDVIVQLFGKTSKTTVWAEVKREEYGGTDSGNYITVYFAAEPSEDIEVIIYSHAGATAAAAVAYS